MFPITIIPKTGGAHDPSAIAANVRLDGRFAIRKIVANIEIINTTLISMTKFLKLNVPTKMCATCVAAIETIGTGRNVKKIKIQNHARAAKFRVSTLAAGCIL